MNVAEPLPDRVYRWQASARLVIGAAIWVLGLGLAIGFVAGAMGLSRRPEPLPVAEAIVALAIIGLPALFFLLAAARFHRAGRLIFEREKALLPRLAIPPTCLLPPCELFYAQVQRYGIGEVSAGVGDLGTLMTVTATSMVFEVMENDGRIRRRYLTLSIYPDPAEVVNQFRQRIGKEPVLLERTPYGGLRFPAI